MFKAIMKRENTRIKRLNERNLSTMAKIELEASSALWWPVAYFKTPQKNAIIKNAVNGEQVFFMKTALGHSTTKKTAL